jgi:hypothetical protein
VCQGGTFVILIDMVGQIELTDSETGLYAQVSEAERLLGVDHDYQRARLAGVASRELFHSLMERHAIPEQRLRYFADKDYNPSNTRASKRELFLRNAHTNDAMYEHPHFWKYLLYFINGTDLPRPIIEQFSEIAADEMRDHDALSKFSRKATRGLAGDSGSKAEAFYKLALDCDCGLPEALGIRRAVMQVKSA